MGDRQPGRDYFGHLEEALSAVLGRARVTSNLCQVLAYAVGKGIVSYEEIKEIVNDDPEEVVFLAFEWRLLLPISTTKSSSWEDRLLLLKYGEIYEIPNIIQYLLEDSLDTRKWQPEKGILRFFEELKDPDYKQIPVLVSGVTQEAVNNRITADKIKMICLRLGLGNRVDSLIAGLKAAGIISPRLRSVPEVNREGSPIYELNPSVLSGLSP
jgi:hypothetical protein